MAVELLDSIAVPCNLTTPAKAIKLGRRAENIARIVEFDMMDFAMQFGEGTCVALHKRSRDSVPYTATLTHTGGNTYTWTVDEDDVAFEGNGSFQLWWIVGGQISKSPIYQTQTLASLDQGTPTPEEKSDLAEFVKDLLKKISETGGYDDTAVKAAITDLQAKVNDLEIKWEDI